MNVRRDSSVRETLLVSRRGQVTLPASIRKRLGMREGGVVTVEEREGEIVLRPAVVLEVETFSDEQVAAWDREDELTNDERAAIRQRFQATKTQ